MGAGRPDRSGGSEKSLRENWGTDLALTPPQVSTYGRNGLLLWWAIAISDWIPNVRHAKCAYLSKVRLATAVMLKASTFDPSLALTFYLTGGV